MLLLSIAFAFLIAAPEHKTPPPPKPSSATVTFRVSKDQGQDGLVEMQPMLPTSFKMEVIENNEKVLKKGDVLVCRTKVDAENKLYWDCEHIKMYPYSTLFIPNGQ